MSKDAKPPSPEEIEEALKAMLRVARRLHSVADPREERVLRAAREFQSACRPAQRAMSLSDFD